jgi:hypothetical protein
VVSKQKTKRRRRRRYLTTSNLHHEARCQAYRDVESAERRLVLSSGGVRVCCGFDTRRRRQHAIKDERTRRTLGWLFKWRGSA